MKINADVRVPARVLAGEQPWVPSPLPGVERRMLERDGGEVARVTSIVRYAPGSRFSPHSHAGGEEFLVLDGIFSDERGDYRAGTYVRNPVGSRHTPHSGPGCVILVKLRWMHPDDRARVCIDTTAAANWQCDGDRRRLHLHRYRCEHVMLLELSAGAVLEPRERPGGEELFVISGRARDPRGELPPHSWLRTPPGRAPEIRALTPCRLYVKHGHLASAPPRFEDQATRG